eukprot:455926-Prorocentrum_minimum.AAC.1
MAVVRERCCNGVLGNTYNASVNPLEHAPRDGGALLGGQLGVHIRLQPPNLPEGVQRGSKGGPKGGQRGSKEGQKGVRVEFFKNGLSLEDRVRVALALTLDSRNTRRGQERSEGGHEGVMRGS